MYRTPNGNKMEQTTYLPRQAVAAAGGVYLEAPVSGSKGPAEAGQLIFLAGGDRALYERARPALDVLGKASFFLGTARALL